MPSPLPGAPGQVVEITEIRNGTDGFDINYDTDGRFGASAAPLGDLDGDGVPDVAIGAPFQSVGSMSDRGTVYTVFLRPNGTTKSVVELVPDGHPLVSSVGGHVALGADIAVIEPGEHENSSLPLRLAVTQ